MKATLGDAGPKVLHAGSVAKSTIRLGLQTGFAGELALAKAKGAGALQERAGSAPGAVRGAAGAAGAAGAGARARREASGGADAGGTGGGAAAHPEPPEALDPAARQLAQLAPPPTFRSPDAAAAPAEARVSVEDLLPALVRKVAWSGDGRRGTVRLELGSGAMAGAEVLVEADHGRVRVRLRAPGGADLEEWRRRIGARLAGRGIAVEELEIV
jgi:hypothetical protein